MYSMENYFWGGVGYLLGVLMVAPLLWRYTRWIPWQPLTALVRIFVLVVLLVPVRPYPDKVFLAPAWAVAAFEYVQPTAMEGAVRGMLPIAAYFLGLYGLYLLSWIWWRRRRTAPNAGRPAPAAAHAMPANLAPAHSVPVNPGLGTSASVRKPTRENADSESGLRAPPKKSARPLPSDWGNRRD